METVADIAPSASDDEVMDMAVKGGCVLIAEDKDFGRLVYAKGSEAVAVLFLRFHVSSRERMISDIIEFIQKTGEDIIGAFVTAEPGKFRIRRLLTLQEPHQSPD